MGGKWITPFLKQSFVTAGVSMNIAAAAIVIGFAIGLMEQLKAPGSTIPIDDSSASWIAAMPTFTMLVGNFVVIPIMGKYGRRNSNLISIAVIVTGWIGVTFSTSIEMLLFARALQGIHLGMSATLGSLLIGEYTTPKNRGSFLMSISILISASYLIVHSVGSYTRWQIGAIVCAAISILNSVIVIYSPESPSWLASKGRYEDSKRVFRWLRGNNEEEELTKMIEANIIGRESKAEVKVTVPFIENVQNSLIYFSAAIKKREFYMPLIVMVHIYAIVSWGGMYILTVYSSELLDKIVGSDANVPLLILSIDVQRIITNIFGIYIVQNTKRRKMIFFTIGVNIVTLSVIAAYSYTRENNALPWDHPIIGVLLTHCLMFAIAVGTLPAAYIISGEIFPLEFKDLAGGLSNFTYSAFSFLALKTIPYSFNNFGIHGTFSIYVLILTYCLIVTWLLMPETKDRTLQDIEDEWRGRPKDFKLEFRSSDLKSLGRPLTAHDLNSVQPLKSLENRD